MARIIAVDVHDVRFPTSRNLQGSDAMNPDPDYSAAYLVLRTDDAELSGYSVTFTIGRGNDLQCAAIEAVAAACVGEDTGTLTRRLGEFARTLTGDSQMRWLGPEKGMTHMAVGAVVNALWDLRARAAGVPLWKLLSDLDVEELVGLVDFRYLTDALTTDRARRILDAARPGRAEREALLRERGYPAYTTGPGWLGYTDETMLRLARQAAADGFTQVKMKVGADLATDLHRMTLVREALGPDIAIAVDANQRWDVEEAIRVIGALSRFDLAWVEEPTSPDDVLAHARIRRATGARIASGEHCHNRVMFKQFLQAEALDVVQIDACRVSGVNENLAILLLAAAHDRPVCPHAGGVGLCEMVQHLAMFDFIAVSGSWDGRSLEYVDSLHEHFEDPVAIEGGRYRAPTMPGFGAQLRPASLERYSYPHGGFWREDLLSAVGQEA